MYNIEVSTSSSSPSLIVSKTARYFDTAVIINGLQHQLLLSNGIGKLKLLGTDFPNRCGILFAEANLNAPLQLHMRQQQTQQLHIYMCLEGELEVRFSGQNVRKLSPLTTLLVNTGVHFDYSIQLPALKPVVLTVFTLPWALAATYISDSVSNLPEELQEVLELQNSMQPALKPIAIQQDLHHKLLEPLSRLRDNRLTGLSRDLFVKAKLLEVLAWFVGNHDGTDDSTQVNSLKKSDLVLIRKARNVLLEDLKNSPTIKQLSRKVGINENKLKRGFKLVYGNTIYKYLRGNRLERARQLILENRLDIGQIAHEVGYKNKSHFAHWFKDKYGVLPKDYIKSYGSNSNGK